VCPLIFAYILLAPIQRLQALIKVVIQTQPNLSFSTELSFDAGLNWTNMAVKSN